MNFSTVSFRKSALALTAAAAIVSFASNPLSAQQLASNTSTGTGTYSAPVDCSSFANAAKRAICRADQQIQSDKQRGAAAQAAGKAADQELNCLNIIMADLQNNGTATASLTAVPPTGQACKTARDLKLITG